MSRLLTPKQVLSRLRTTRRAITVLDRVVISPDAEGREAIAADAKRQRDVLLSIRESADASQGAAIDALASYAEAVEKRFAD